MKRREQRVGTNPENQGVASDRVYSGLVLPRERVSSYLAFPSLPRLLLIAQNKIPSEFLGAIFSLDVGIYALRHKNHSFCTTTSSRGTVGFLRYIKQPWRFISVALSRESPPADVIRYPAL